MKCESRDHVVAVVAGSVGQRVGVTLTMPAPTTQRAQSTKWQSSPMILPPPLLFCCTQ